MVPVEFHICWNVIFVHSDIASAMMFDPFTHVYMFIIGFPPDLWTELARIWNSSQATYLICYHQLRHLKQFEFNIVLIEEAAITVTLTDV
jgi:hypothetical protein